MTVQQAISREHNEAQIGRTLSVILDQPVENEDNVWIGRSVADAPDIDGVVYITGNEQPLQAGQIIRAEIVAAKEYDLVGVALSGNP